MQRTGRDLSVAVLAVVLVLGAGWLAAGCDRRAPGPIGPPAVAPDSSQPPRVICDGKSCRLAVHAEATPADHAKVPCEAAGPTSIVEADSSLGAFTAPSGPAGAYEAPSQIECPNALLAGDVPADVREWYRNRTSPGSCVQCSIGMCGCAQAVPNAALLLWLSDFGPPELHGSTPSRVAAYARKRGLAIWNVTGAENTYPFMRWSCRNGRPCAISCNQAHFQTLLGHDPGPTAAASDDRWFVVDNNSPQRIDVYADAEFRRRHEAMGRSSAWVVILDSPPVASRPEYVAWWR